VETVPLAVVRGMTMSMFHLSPSRVNFRGVDVSLSLAQRVARLTELNGVIWMGTLSDREQLD
jgi:hypothetical protein